MMQTLDDIYLSYSAVKNVCANIQHGDFQVQNTAWSGRTSPVTIPEIIDDVHDLIWSVIHQSKELLRHLRYPRFIIDEQL